MNRENFLVRERLQAVDHFRKRGSWDGLQEDDVYRLKNEVADLPAETDDDEIESRMFDLTVLRMQLAISRETPTSSRSAGSAWSRSPCYSRTSGRFQP